MKLAIVGSVQLAGNPLAKRIIEAVLDKWKPTVVVSGGAVGIDTMAAEAARERAITVLEFLPKHPRWEPEGYKERNLLIARNCDALVRISSKSSRTYGSGWTRDQAKELGKPTEEYLI